MGVGNGERSAGEQGQRESKARGRQELVGENAKGKGGPVTMSSISLTFTVTDRIYDLPRDVQAPKLLALCMMG